VANGNNLNITDLVKLAESQNANRAQELGAQNQMDMIIALNDMQNNNKKWGSGADQAWFPQGGKLFPEIGGGMQVPEGSGDILNMLVTMMTGGTVGKGIKSIVNRMNQPAKGLKMGNIPVSWSKPNLPTVGKPSIGKGMEESKYDKLSKIADKIGMSDIGKKALLQNVSKPTMLNQLTKKKGTYYPAPGYKPKMGKSVEYAPGVNIARDPSTWTKEGERIIQQLLDMGIDIINK